MPKEISMPNCVVCSFDARQLSDLLNATREYCKGNHDAHKNSFKLWDIIKGLFVKESDCYQPSRCGIINAKKVEKLNFNSTPTRI